MDREPANEFSGKVCGRLHIDEFDKYYYEFQELLAASEKGEKKRKKLQKEILFLKELVENQNKILNALNFEPSMLLSHKSELQRYKKRSEIFLPPGTTDTEWLAQLRSRAAGSIKKLQKKEQNRGKEARTGENEFWLLGGESESEGEDLFSLFPGDPRFVKTRDQEAQVDMAPIL